MNVARTLHSLSLSLSLALVPACFSAESSDERPNEQQASLEPVKAEVSPPLPQGVYEVQSVSYDDATGAYTTFLLNPPPGRKPTFTATEVRMARIDDAALQQGKKTYLQVDAQGPALFLTPDFQIAYTHNVLEERVDPSTGQRDVIVVRQESSNWSPFFSAMAGAAIGNMLFSPSYYYPPPYRAGGLVGYGGMGSTREAASRSFQQTHGALPQPAKLSATGVTPKKAPQGSLRSSGAGAGSSRLKATDSSRAPSRSKSFGFGGRRRR